MQWSYHLCSTITATTSKFKMVVEIGVLRLIHEALYFCGSYKLTGQLITGYRGYPDTQILRVHPEISGFVIISQGQSQGQPFLRVGEFWHNNLPYMEIFVKMKVYSWLKPLFLRNLVNTMAIGFTPRIIYPFVITMYANLACLRVWAPNLRVRSW